MFPSHDREGEIVHLLQLSKLLDHLVQGSFKRLYIPYLPYARQDKNISDKSTFALITLCEMLACNFDEILALDVHSDVINQHLDNFVNIEPDRYIKLASFVCNPDMICFPDVGALTRYAKLVTEDLKKPFIVCRKNRNPLNGDITGMDLLGDPSGKNILMIDDICDGGRTFIEASKLLSEYGADDVNLYTTHGIYSKGVKPLLEEGCVSRIFNYKGEILHHH